jgi:adenylosuccinate synthase
MLDLDFGTYPFVTSSSTGVASVGTGLGVAPNKIQTTIGVVKAYTTRVGSGPFPTEETGDIGTHMQTKGLEWGVTTGRKRRCGWLDMNVLRYTNMINGYSSINLTKIDILDEISELKIGVGYQLDGQLIETIPASLEDLARCTVVYETLPGWKSDTSGVTEWKQLPVQAQNYIKRIHQLLGVPVSWVGTGPKRENMLLNPSFK